MSGLSALGSLVNKTPPLQPSPDPQAAPRFVAAQGDQKPQSKASGVLTGQENLIDQAQAPSTAQKLLMG